MPSRSFGLELNGRSQINPRVVSVRPRREWPQLGLEPGLALGCSVVALTILAAVAALSSV